MKGKICRRLWKYFSEDNFLQEINSFSQMKKFTQKQN